MICPCCGQTVDHEDPERIAFVAGLWPTQKAILAAVMAASPRPLPAERLVHAVYGDRIDGGPDDAEGCIHSHVSKANDKLERQGLRITAMLNGQRLGGYVVVPLPATHVKHSANGGAGHG